MYFVFFVPTVLSMVNKGTKAWTEHLTWELFAAFNSFTTVYKKYNSLTGEKNVLTEGKVIPPLLPL